jgi:hypothetical protein
MKFVAANFAVEVVGVRDAKDPLTTSLAHIARCFLTKEILVARLVVFK